MNKCKHCIYYKTYVCPNLYSEKIEPCNCGEFADSYSKEKVIEMAMCAVCGREEYRSQIEEAVNKMNEDELKSEWERYMIMFSV